MTFRPILISLWLIILSTLSMAEAQAGLQEQILERGKLQVGVALFTPWVLKDKTGELSGFEIAVAKQLAADMGVQAEFAVYEWNKLLEALEKAEIDVIIAGMAITPERALRVNFSRPYATSGITIATNLELTKNVQRLEDLNREGVNVVAVTGTVAENLAKKLFPQASIKAFESSDQAAKAIVDGKAHAYIESTPLPQFIALENPERVDVPLTKPLLSYKAGLAIRKGEPDFLSFLDAWVTAREADGWLSSTHRYWFESLRWRAEDKL